MTSPGQRFRQRAKGRTALAQGASGAAPFASFIERHEDRERRARGKRRMFLISIAVHVAVFGLVWLFSNWKVDELFGRRVEVSLLPQPFVPGADGKPAHTNPSNIGRALGVHLIVTPFGTRTEPRTDAVAASEAWIKALRPVVLARLLPSLLYPPEAQPLKLRGSVSVLVDVDNKGKVTQLDVKLPCANELLCQMAKASVAQIERWPVVGATAERSFLIPIEYRPE